MAQSPKVSIVIPVYNGDNFLKEAIESALAQSYQNTEIIVVNDGSKDDGKTEAIAKSYGDKIRYFSKPNGGVASALNLGIKEMTGEYFSWLSHDDLYEPSKVQRQVDVLLNMGDDKFIAYSDYTVFSDSSNSYPVYLEGVLPKHFRYWLTIQNSLHGCTLLIPKKAFAECGVFDETLCTTQDYDLWFRLAKEYRFVHIPELLVKSRQHSEQGSVQMSDLAKKECDALMKSFVNNLTSDEISSIPHSSVALAYKFIGDRMKLRDFKEAANLAYELATKNGLSKKESCAVSNEPLITSGKLKGFIRKILPQSIIFKIKTLLAGFRGGVKPLLDSDNPELKGKFTEIYDKDLFGGSESRSGEGSNLFQTQVIRDAIPRIINDFNIKSMIDAPCGDWYWMRHVKLDVDKYTGIDIVDPLIKANNKKFANESVSFEVKDLTKDSLPKCDLIFSRDLLVHLTYEDAIKVIANFKKSGAKYLLTTTFVDRAKNNDLVGEDSFWRALNLQLAPFNFPEPILVVNEECTEEAGIYKDKSLALWLLKDIKLSKEFF